jgi:hypothetical protein
MGAFALFSNTMGIENTASGEGALQSNTTGGGNAASGYLALALSTTGHNNTANGTLALFSNTMGTNNTANGALALFSNTTGNGNTALGFQAGHDLTTGDNNIDIGVNVVGMAGESNTIRIGNLNIVATFIRGISGTAVAGTAVVVDANGQLGVAPSSKRFKNDIKPMEKASEALLSLKPVTFRYKKQIDPKGTSQFGLVAEDVEKVNPDLVVRDKNGEIYTVRYDQVNAMLLNEFLKEHRKVEQQQVRISELNSRLAKQDVIVAQQQKGMEVLSAQLEEQAAQIQKVSAQIELNRSMPQMVQSNR